ncbi:mannose-6-phosphate isomerase, class I [Streptacidiphilus jiangxiensis]|uniref:mannose-6-phosphate isomerase n=1 Tax=Streptacidiphilus jiangxiensis TaxID=235985 RepID=A0A1H7YTF2_STRJI|nr:mannose-6-phosphate isomerase, class I [Streptacidiphilus jiangxiensis]SEM49243.1 mannose-6-phosphate isomerase [Streptacidiphilus jiangxiensis]
MDRLENAVRPYAWGSRTAIPALLGQEPSGEPQAELWMGAHPGAPSGVDRGAGGVSLDRLIAADPERELGAATVARFGAGLPFLFKVLAAGEPLSVQVHPDLARARAGFAAEEAAGVPLEARERNYKDANHKPEMLCALEEFTGVCGFRAPLSTVALLERLGVAGLRPVVDVLRAKPETEALREALTWVLTLDNPTVIELVGATRDALLRLAGESASPAEALMLHDYAVLADHYPADPGLLSALLLNHVVLRPGEAVYLGAGVPHAYFRGLGVELMANSDNVLRAGLTPKHIDVPELLRVVEFAATEPGVIRPRSVAAHPGEELYPAPIDEFRLSRYREGSWPLPTDTPQILLCTGGRVVLTDATGEELVLTPGQSCFIAAHSPAVTVTGEGEDAILFRATVSV